MRTREAGLTLLLALLAAGSCARPPGPAGIRIGLPTPVISLDPHATNDWISFIVDASLYEPLVATDEDLRPVPRLAAHWVNLDERTWVFELREGVRFHDGSPLTGAEVAFSLQRARSDPRSEWGAGLQDVVAIETPAPSKVLLRTREPQPTLLQALAQTLIVPRGAGDIASSTLARRPVGTGPYRFVSEDGPGGAVRLVVWEGYWGRRPALGGVSFVTVADDRARLAALRAGQLDLATDLPAELAGAVAASPGLRLVEVPGLMQVSLGFDVAREHTPFASPARNPFRDLRVRRAFRAAIDGERLVREAASGEPAYQVVPRRVFGSDPGLPAPRPDPALARRLLQEAGWADGFAVVLDGPAASFLGDQRVPPFLARVLGDVGVRVELRLQAKPELYRRYATHDTSLYLTGWHHTTGDAQEALDFLLHTPDPARGYGSENAGGYANPRLDLLANEARHTMAVDARLGLLRAAQHVALEDAAWVPLYVPLTRYGARKDLHFAPRPDQLLRVEEMTVAGPQGE